MRFKDAVGDEVLPSGFPALLPRSLFLSWHPTFSGLGNFLELALDLVSEVRKAPRKSGSFVFGDRLPFLSVSTRRTNSLTEASPKKESPTRRQGETALTYIKFFLSPAQS